MNYLNETIDSLNCKLKSGAVSADQLAKDTIANIKKTDEKINAFITVDEDAKPAEDLDFNNKLAGVPIAIKDNIITNGCHEAVFLSLMAVCKPGDLIAIESPVYFNFLSLIEQLGYRTLEIPSSEKEGINLDVLEFVL